MAGETLLAPTKSQKTRVSRWEGVTFGRGRSSGVLSLWTGGPRQSLYTVREFTPGDGFAGRSFHLTRVLGGRAGDPSEASYDLLIGAFPSDSRCDCIGFERHGRCKHVDALASAIAEGQLDNDPALPCPFCGGAARVEESVPGCRWWVVCQSAACGVGGPGRYDKDEALRVWNTRPGPGEKP